MIRCRETVRLVTEIHLRISKISVSNYPKFISFGLP
jgi:hypothetical protein